MKKIKFEIILQDYLLMYATEVNRMFVLVWLHKHFQHCHKLKNPRKQKKLHPLLLKAEATNQPMVSVHIMPCMKCIGTKNTLSGYLQQGIDH